MDTRKHTRSPFRPDPEAVSAYLSAPTDAAFEGFRRTYLQRLNERFAENPKPFEQVAQQAAEGDVFLGCSCPTQKNPDVARCHTVLALRFMAERFPELEVSLP